MKAAFINDYPENISNVYSEQVLAALHEQFDFYDGIYGKDNSDKLSEVECIFSTWGMPAFSEEEIKEFFPKLKIVFYAAGTVQYFARPFLNLGIKVISGWKANAVPVIEYTVAQILLANKGFFTSMRMCKSKESYDEAFKYSRACPGNFGSRVGLICLGAIGSGVAQRLKDYRLEVYAYDPFTSDERANELGVKLVGLEELFEKCHIISNHAPNLPATQGMINKKHFAKMGDTAAFINTGRGAQIVLEDMLDTLRAHPLQIAVLDVTDPEEPPENGSPLYTMPNVFLTPHIAGSIGDEYKRLSEYIADDALAFIENKPLKYEVTLKMLETMA